MTKYVYVFDEYALSGIAIGYWLTKRRHQAQKELEKTKQVSKWVEELKPLDYTPKSH